MGKVKDGTTASKPAKPSKGGASNSGSSMRRFAQFLANLFSADLYKPLQGRHARIYTAAGLGIVVVLGLYRLFHNLNDSYGAGAGYGGALGLGALIGWFIFRVVQYPPFVEFLIATESEMNKVSWTSREDLYRATSVVLVTVTLMSVYLFGVDYVWATTLKLLGVLKFGGDGAFGSNAG